MPETGPLSFPVVCEAPADKETASSLADRVLYSEVDWIEPEVLDAYRQWRGLSDAGDFLDWHDVPALARLEGLKAHGHFGRVPAENYARVARLALMLLQASANCPEAATLIIDTDGDTTRSRGLDQARQSYSYDFPVAVGVAHTKRESWVLAGFIPHGEEEEERVAALRRELGFDPCARADRLTAKHEGAKKNVKRVLGTLTRGDREREHACWQEAPLETLRERGSNTGLTDYLAEVRDTLVPLFKHMPSH